MPGIPEEFKGLNLDQSLEKIINENLPERLGKDTIINIIKAKLIDYNFSDQDDQLQLKATDILNHVEKNKGSLSYLIGTQAVVSFIQQMKDTFELKSYTSSSGNKVSNQQLKLELSKIEKGKDSKSQPNFFYKALKKFLHKFIKKN